MSEFRSGYVSIIGKPNVGKSTLLNQLVDQKISIVTRKPQTTRWSVNGIKTSENYQIVFIDTPGLQVNPKLALNRYMNKEVSNSLIFVNVIIFVIEALKWNELDWNVVKLLKNLDRPKIILAINKIDKVSKKEKLLSNIDLISKKVKFDEIIPISATKKEGLNDLIELAVKNIPVSEPLYPNDQITNRSERFFAAEFIREKLIMRLSNEIPHHLSVTIEEFRDTKNILHIDACIWVEKESHKSIVIGKEGKVLKDVGTLARNDLEKFFNKNINLKTWVKIKNKWADSRTALKQFGY